MRVLPAHLPTSFGSQQNPIQIDNETACNPSIGAKRNEDEESVADTEIISDLDTCDLSLPPNLALSRPVKGDRDLVHGATAGSFSTTILVRDDSWHVTESINDTTKSKNAPQTDETSISSCPDDGLLRPDSTDSKLVDLYAKFLWLI